MLLFRYIFGFLIIRIKGENNEKLLNIAAKNRIRLWSLRCEKGDIIGNIRINDFKKLRSLIRGQKINIKITKKCGLPFKFKKYNKRIGFFIGILIFFTILRILSGYIWCIEISGNKNLSDAEILKECKNIGIFEGVKTSKIDSNNDAKKLTIGKNGISWASLNIEGSLLTVNVTEIKEEDKNETATNLKAKCDGEITMIDVTSGNVVVKIGDTVSKGDLLVSGIIESLGNTVYVHTSGVVYAKTTHKYSANGYFKTTQNVKTDKIINHKILTFFGIEIPLYIGAIREENEHTRSVTRLKLFNKNMPIGISNNTFTFLEKKTVKYNKEELIKILKNDIDKQIKDSKIDDFEIIDRQITENEDGISIYITIKTVENIAKEENLLINTTN